MEQRTVREMNEQAGRSLRRNGPKAARLAVAVVVVVVVLVVGALLVALTQKSDGDPAGSPASSAPGADATQGGGNSQVTGSAGSGAQHVKKMLTHIRAGDDSYKDYLTGNPLLVFTPLDGSVPSWATGQQNGDATAYLDTLTAAQWNSLSRALTLNGTVDPATLKITKVNDNGTSDSWGISFTIKTTAGTTVDGEAKGRVSGSSPDRGRIQVLTYRR